MLESIQEKSNDVVPVDVFCSYSHSDEFYRELLDKHLISMKHEGLISDWHDRKILAGAEWQSEINEQLEKSGLFLLLISPDFMASKYCYEIETKKAIERHNAGKAYVLPIILRPVDWMNSPLGSLQALPKNGKALSTWSNIDEGFLDVVQGIRKRIFNLGKRNESAGSAQIVYTISIEGTLKEFDKDKLDNILNQLKELSGDITLSLRNVRSGSIILLLSGTEKGLQRLLELHEQKKLSSLLEIEVMHISRANSSVSVNPAKPIRNQVQEVHTLYVGNLPYSLTEKELREIFEEYGTINNVKIITDRDTGRSKGFGFVEMAANDINAAVAALNSLSIKDKKIIVNISQPRPTGESTARRVSRRFPDRNESSM